MDLGNRNRISRPKILPTAESETGSARRIKASDYTQIIRDSCWARTPDATRELTTETKKIRYVKKELGRD
jgi:hypothetical protein